METSNKDREPKETFAVNSSPKDSNSLRLLVDDQETLISKIVFYI